MTEVTKPEKAELREMDADFKNEKNKEKWTKVQFNPETLKVSFANQLVSPDGGGDKTGPAPRQFVGAGTTKLSLQIWFDITVPQPDGLPVVDDVRKLTQRVAYFITPRQDPPGSNTFFPPAVRFLWGSFQFDGLMDSLKESLEFFSQRWQTFTRQHEPEPLATKDTGIRNSSNGSTGRFRWWWSRVTFSWNQPTHTSSREYQFAQSRCELRQGG